MRGTLPVALALLAVLAAPAAAEEESFALENGLRVTLMPLPAAKTTALVVLYDFGELTDPEGESGMAHLMEHLYVTAAAGDIPARTAEEWMGAYRPPGGTNAQTGSDYTVLATVFPPGSLDTEIAEAAARMSDLDPTEEILAREKRRLIFELGNMFDRFPDLAAANRAREHVVPSPEGARKGGIREQVESITLEEAKARLAAYYRPANARIVLAGPLPDDARARIEKAFGGLPAGTPAPASRDRAEPSPGGIDRHESSGPSFATAAYAVPAPESPLYPAFLILVARVYAQLGPGGIVLLQYTPVDEPEVLRIKTAADDEGPDKTVEGLRALAQTLLVPDSAPERQLARWKAATREAFGLLFGFPPLQAAMNPYGAAFGRGRAMQMGIDPEYLAKRIDAVTPWDLLAAAKALFSPGRAAIVVVRPK